MATTVLATAGRAFGGPWGAALGALAGRAIERAGGAGRADDLPVQSSAYGVVIPRVFGVMRVAGNLVWSTPIMPGETGKGGAGRGAVASFALVLAQAPVRWIGRIWADGTLLRDAEGRPARRFIMREHLTGGLAPDPLLSAAHPGRAPGYAGLAYVVFENLDLGPFGGRLPNLAFEVVGDDGGPDAWAFALTGRPVQGGGPLGRGFAARGGLRDDADDVGMLAGARPAGTPDGMDWVADAPGSVPVSIRAEQLLGAMEIVSRTGRGAATEVAYLDVSRDHQRGVQRAGDGYGGRMVEVAAAMTAEEAAQLAGRLAADEPGRAELRLSLPWKWLGLRAGAFLRLRGDHRLWRVMRRTVVGMQVELVCESVAPPPFVAGDTGGSGETALRQVPPTRIALIVLPGRGVLAAVGGGAGWEGARVLARAGDGGGLRDLGFVTESAPVGQLAVAAPGADGVLVVEVDTAEALALGAVPGAPETAANQVCIGGELIGAESFRVLASGRLELAGLHRGLDGTRAVTHSAGSPAVFMSGPLLPLDAPEGAVVRVVATGPGDPEGGVEASVVAGLHATPALPAGLQDAVMGVDAA